MPGPLDTPPLPTYRISPMGIATRKYSGGKCLVIDLSAPHQCATPSINSLIPSEYFDLSYATIDQAITLIRQAGQGRHYKRFQGQAHPSNSGTQWKGNSTPHYG